MLAHGVYHILGYDHQDEASASIMEAKEISTLGKLHINNPYN
jgi:probable rRNA maturation factor